MDQKLEGTYAVLWAAECTLSSPSSSNSVVISVETLSLILHCLWQKFKINFPQRQISFRIGLDCIFSLRKQTGDENQSLVLLHALPKQNTMPIWDVASLFISDISAYNCDKYVLDLVLNIIASQKIVLMKKRSAFLVMFYVSYKNK